MRKSEFCPKIWNLGSCPQILTSTNHLFPFPVTDWMHLHSSHGLFQVTHATQHQGKAHKELEYPDGLKLLSIFQTLFSHLNNRTNSSLSTVVKTEELKNDDYTLVLSHGTCFALIVLAWQQRGILPKQQERVMPELTVSTTWCGISNGYHFCVMAC